MPNKNKDIPFNESSIHLFVNGFSFFTHSKTEFIPITKDIGDLESSLQELLSFYPKGAFSNIKCLKKFPKPFMNCKGSIPLWRSSSYVLSIP